MRGTRAKRLAVLQNLMNMGVLILFAVIVMLRMQSPDRVAGGGLLLVELIALVAAFFGAWYGGEIVNRRTAPPSPRPPRGASSSPSPCRTVCLRAMGSRGSSAVPNRRALNGDAGSWC